MRTGAVITAAGLSRRMQEFKPLLPITGETIIRHCVNNFIETGCDPVIVVTGHEAERIKDHLADLPVECIFNPAYAQSDMFESVRCGLKAAGGRCDRIFFTPCDIPLIRPETLELMLATDALVIQPQCGGRTGHPVLIANELIPEITAYQGRQGLKGALGSLGVSVCKAETNDPGILMDADTPEDYAMLLHYLKKNPV